MTQEQIIQAFEGRWRMKRYIIENIDGKAAKEIAKDFFEAGILLGEGFSVAEDENGIVIYKHDPVLDTADYGFSTWWKLYDKMVGRKDCEKKWAKLSFAEKDACIHATPAYVASTPDKQFRKNPLSYLNQKAWNDEIIIRNGTDNKPTTDAASRLADILIG